MTRLFTDFDYIDKAVLMMQSEVCDKTLAAPSAPGYCMLTVLCNAFYQPEKLFTVPPHCFAPQPGVDSAVVAFTAHPAPIVAGAVNSAPSIAKTTHPVPIVELSERELFISVVRAAFATRRKTLANCLVAADLAPDRASAEAAAARAGIPSSARGESLSAQTFAVLARELMRM